MIRLVLKLTCSKRCFFVFLLPILDHDDGDNADDGVMEFWYKNLACLVLQSVWLQICHILENDSQSALRKTEVTRLVMPVTDVNDSDSSEEAFADVLAWSDETDVKRMLKDSVQVVNEFERTLELEDRKDERSSYHSLRRPPPLESPSPMMPAISLPTLHFPSPLQKTFSLPTPSRSGHNELPLTLNSHRRWRDTERSYRGSPGLALKSPRRTPEIPVSRWYSEKTKLRLAANKSHPVRHVRLVLWRTLTLLVGSSASGILWRYDYYSELESYFDHVDPPECLDVLSPRFNRRCLVDFTPVELERILGIIEP